MSDSPATTDPQDELFAVLDANGEPTGATRRRAEVHRDGDWHGALHIWVGGIGPDARPFALFQRRSLSKDTWPGALDVAVGGHVRAGEGLAEAVREAEEEIGLVLRLGDVTRLGRRFARSAVGMDNEVQEVFAVRSDRDLAGYRLDPDEVDGVIRVGLEEATALFAGHRRAVPAFELRRDARSEVPAAIEIAVTDFAAGETGGYAVCALRGLRDVVYGRNPALFELR